MTRLQKSACCVAVWSAWAIAGCGGSSTVVVDEEAIKSQIAKVEGEERSQRKREEVLRASQPQQQLAEQVDSERGAEGSN